MAPDPSLPCFPAPSATQPARRIASAYVLVSAAWILLSDAALAALLQDPVLLSAGQTVKGWVFVLLTGLVLYKLIAASMGSRLAAVAALRQSEAEFRAAFEQAAAGMAKIGDDGRIVRANERLCQILGYTQQELGRLSLGELVYPADAERGGEGQAEGYSMEEKRYLRKDGEPVWLRVFTSSVCLGGTPLYVLKVIEDIDSHRKADRELSLAARALENAAEGVLITRGNIVVSANRAFSNITGYRAEEVIGTSVRRLYSQERASWVAECWRRLKEGGTWQGDVSGRRRNGEIYPAWASISAISDDEEQGRRFFVTVFSDLSLNQAYEQRLQFLALHDVLTGLPNRTAFIDRIDEAVRRAARNRTSVAVLHVDLDRFKPINDTLGQEYGDDLLRQVSQRLSASVRETDTVARIGGDEFAVLLENLRSSREAAMSAASILGALASAYTLRDQGEHFISASIGVSCLQEDAASAQEMLNHADIAMYRAKQEGRNRYRFFSAEMNRQLAEKLALSNSLRHAVERGELLLNYQPQVALDTRELVGIEALVRWKHPERGILPPSDFIFLAEETGLIREIGEWVLREAARQLRRWRAEGLVACPMSVNLSPRQFEDDQLPARIKDAILQAGIGMGDIELEITESTLMNDPRRGEAMLREFESYGIRLALDDFGTGYSSLSYLKRFPVKTLKIDKSFVGGLLEDENDIAITRAIIAMAKNLGLCVVAEGVENEAQQDFLATCGCDSVQGYLLSPPLPAQEMRAFMLSRRSC